MHKNFHWLLILLVKWAAVVHSQASSSRFLLPSQCVVWWWERFPASSPKSINSSSPFPSSCIPVYSFLYSLTLCVYPWHLIKRVLNCGNEGTRVLFLTATTQLGDLSGSPFPHQEAGKVGLDNS